MIWRVFGAICIPAIKQPSGLDSQDGKRISTYCSLKKILECLAVRL